MLLELDDQIVQSTGMSPEELRLELALQLYKEEKITVGQGGKMTGIGSIKFQQELGKRKISSSFNNEDLQSDLKTLAALFQ
ncbi:UPF0175 family protein [Dyadobacter sp. CY343]|uniref:UPF0175 family protein n=1 Tax=Dyadobacter sp. CY343 TaxID=2907299 RepID=UPI001F25A5E2|nr:UPF0175 family protein [Dyadobacter sp. CY343]MCE7061139.1 UPF0175 family protein [Dyadobacter sp. CY343]